MEWRTLYDRLADRFDTEGWWPADSPFEVMIGAVLTQNTTWTSVEQALERLRQAGALSVPGIASCPPDRLRELIRPAGSYTRKAATLQAVATWVQARDPSVAAGRWPTTQAGSAPEGEAAPSGTTNGAVTTEGEAAPSSPAGWSTARLRESLLSIKGIGPETTDDILLYVYRRPVFIFDAYGRRMLEAAGMEVGRDYESTRLLHEADLAASGLSAAELAAFHGLVVTAGKVARREGWDRVLGGRAGDERQPADTSDGTR